MCHSNINRIEYNFQEISTIEICTECLLFVLSWRSNLTALLLCCHCCVILDCVLMYYLWHRMPWKIRWHYLAHVQKYIIVVSYLAYVQKYIIVVSYLAYVQKYIIVVSQIRKNIYRPNTEVIFFSFTDISNVHKSFITNNSIFTEYCLTQWISKLPGSFETHWVKQYLVNFMGLSGIVNAIVCKTKPIFIGFRLGKLS